MIDAFLLAVWMGLWILGGLWLAGAAFRLEKGEGMLVGLAAGLALENLLANLLVRFLPFPIAIWSAAGLTAILGLAAVLLQEGPRSLLRLALAWRPLLVLAVLSLLAFGLGRGFGLFDEFLQLPTISLMAAGSLPPRFALDPAVPYEYHYFLLFSAAQVMRIANLPPWTALDLMRGLVTGLALCLAFYWTRRMTRSAAAGVLGAAFLFFASGARWLLLLLPPGLLRTLSGGLELLGSGAASGADLSAALASPWAIEGAGPIPFPFAFANGIAPPGVLLQFVANGLTEQAFILALLLVFSRRRGWVGNLTAAVFVSAMALLTEAGVVLELAGLGLVVLITLLPPQRFKGRQAPFTHPLPPPSRAGKSFFWSFWAPKAPKNSVKFSAPPFRDPLRAPQGCTPGVCPEGAGGSGVGSSYACPPLNPQRGLSPSRGLPSSLWTWLAVVLGGQLLGAWQGGALWGIALRSLVAALSNGGSQAGDYHTIGFQFVFPPTVVSSHLGVLSLGNLGQALLALAELGPLLLALPLLFIWGWKAARAGRWYEAALAGEAFFGLGILFIQFTGSEGIRNTSRLYRFPFILVLFAVPLGWNWLKGRGSALRWSAAALAGATLLGGVGIFAAQLPALQKPVYTYFVTEMDARIFDHAWNRLEPGALVFDLEPYRAPTLLGRYTNSSTTWYALKPEWKALFLNPLPAAARAYGFDYAYMDNFNFAKLTPAVQAAWDAPCVRLVEEAAYEGYWRRLYDIQGCQ